MGIFDRLFGKKSDEANDNKEQQLPKGVKFVDKEEFERIRSGSGGSKIDTLNTGALNFNMGEKLRTDGKREQARNSYLHAVENVSQLATKNNDPQALLILYSATMRLADMYLEDDDLENAASFYEQAAKAAWVRADIDPRNYQNHMDSAHKYQMAAYCRTQQGKYHEAYEFYRSSQQIIRRAEGTTGKTFVHPDREYRTFDSYRAEACLKMMQLMHDHPKDIKWPDDALKLYQEGVDPLAKIASTEDRKYDLVNGIYLGAMCLEDGNKQANLKVADETCEMFMKDCQNRVRFMKLQKAIRKEL